MQGVLCQSCADAVSDTLQRKVRVDLHSYSSDAVMIQDYAQQKTTIITPANATDPNGSCTVSGGPVITQCSCKPLVEPHHARSFMWSRTI